MMYFSLSLKTALIEVFANSIDPDEANLKKCWFAMLLLTHPKQALPKKIYCLSEKLFFISNSVNKPIFKIIKSCILIEEKLQRLLLYVFSPYKQHL